MILPGAAGDYAAAFGPGGIARLKAWVQNGGTLVAIEEGVNFVQKPFLIDDLRHAVRAQFEMSSQS